MGSSVDPESQGPMVLWLHDSAIPTPEWSRGWSHYAEAMASRDRDDPNERAWLKPDS